MKQAVLVLLLCVVALGAIAYLAAPELCHELLMHIDIGPRVGPR